MNNSKIVWVPFSIMENFMKDVLMGVGVPEQDAEICADVLIKADKLGIDSHGINRLKRIYYDRIKIGIQEPVTEFEIIRDKAAIAVVDGHNGMGQVISKKSMEIAINKAAEFGIGMVAARNSTHYGIAGYYALMATERDMIGITGTNARPSIAPTFGTENMLGTNPLTFGMPTDEDFPFLLDCATSVSQRGKIETYARKGEDIPGGWVINKDGKTETDSVKILKDLIDGNSALVPLGGIGEDTAGYKGYGYAAVVEILSAALQSGNFMKMLSGFNSSGEKIPYKLGHFFIAVDISAFTDPKDFKNITGNILRSLRNSEKMPGQDRIYTAGEKEHIAWLERKDKGVPLSPDLQEEIKQLVAELSLKGYDFPF
ncbi:MAG: Ldh family oxidoreductase [Elusimicrobiota bacterium]